MGLLFGETDMLSDVLRWRLGGRLGFGLLGVLGLSAPAAAQSFLPPNGAAPPAAEAVLPAHPAGAPLSVYDCIQIALQRQPTLAAQRASLASAQISYRALCDTQCLRSLLAPDIEYRKKQALRGVAAADAELSQLEWDTVYAVTRTYYTAVYARQQAQVADKVVENLKYYLQLVKDIVETGANRDLNQSTVDKLAIYLGIAQTRQAEAVVGVDRAKAALQEAMGVGHAYPVEVPEVPLPKVEVALDKESVIAMALARRGEVIQAGLAAEVFQLEICAQGEIRFRPLTRTFASGSDIHARPIPGGSRGVEYIPGAIGPEMPVSVFGRREDRVARVTALSARADAVYEKTRSLIALEAENAYLRWVEASRKVAAARDAYEAGRRLSKATRSDIELGIKREEILTNEVIAGQAISAYNEALFEQVVALADLERITAGGVRVPWPVGVPPAPKDENDKNGPDAGGKNEVRSGPRGPLLAPPPGR